ncbi:MAG: MFS transporter [Mycolicibacterium sp.]|uniref:MFS transporter n=1 Tax=Mycolicibacterium sp. TaxID=2320850 RepID=UPI003D0A3D59
MKTRGADPTEVSDSDRRRALFAGSVGNGFEWFDWTIYALLAPWFAKEFFPESIASAALLSSFAVFAVGFLARPLGGLVFGWLTERHGRAACLKIAIFLMAFSGLAMGLAPTAPMIGTWAALFIVVVRLVQGFAFGGELPAAVSYLTYFSPANRTARFLSWYGVSMGAATLFGSVLVLGLNWWLSDDQMAVYGWRVPFLVGAVIAVYGLYVRTRAPQDLHPETSSAREHWRKLFKESARGAVVTAVAAASAPAVFFAAIAAFPATAIALRVNSDTAYLVNAAALALMVALIFVAPLAAERWSLRSVWATAILLNALVIAVGFAVFYASPGTAVTVQLAIVVPFAFVQGTVQALCVSTLHPAVIGLAMGTAWTIPASLIGGTAPMLMAWANKHGHPMYFVWYLVAVCVIAGVVVLAIGKPRPKDTDRL